MTGSHGHVTPRPDGQRARCGGPRICQKCALESANKTAATPEQIAQAFHEAYERLAPEHGYKTREASAVPWADVPAANKSLMTAVAAELIREGVISV